MLIGNSCGAFYTKKRVPLLKLSSVEKRRLERPTPTSRTWCATNCATSRNAKHFLDYKICSLTFGQHDYLLALIVLITRYAQKRVQR